MKFTPHAAIFVLLLSMASFGKQLSLKTSFRVTPVNEYIHLNHFRLDSITSYGPRFSQNYSFVDSVSWYSRNLSLTIGCEHGSSDSIILLGLNIGLSVPLNNILVYNESIKAHNELNPGDVVTVRAGEWIRSNIHYTYDVKYKLWSLPVYGNIRFQKNKYYINIIMGADFYCLKETYSECSRHTDSSFSTPRYYVGDIENQTTQYNTISFVSPLFGFDVGYKIAKIGSASMFLNLETSFSLGFIAMNEGTNLSQEYFDATRYTNQPFKNGIESGHFIFGGGITILK